MDCLLIRDNTTFYSKNHQILQRTPRDNNRQTFLFIYHSPFSPPPIKSSLMILFSHTIKFKYSSKMHFQIQHPSWGYYPTPRTFGGGTEPVETVVRLASESAVVIFSLSSCCMCHAVKSLFCGMGVSPTVHELDQDPRGKEIERALLRLLGNSTALPVVFIGGKLIGAMDRVMGSHINGTLVPLLKEAGALWL